MKIQPVSQFYKNNSMRNISFRSICPATDQQTTLEYVKYASENKEFEKLFYGTTFLARGLQTRLAVARLLNPKDKIQIKILGCSDGTTATAFAIAIREVFGSNFKNVQIEGVDNKPYFIDIANTGCTVLSDKEKSIFDLEFKHMAKIKSASSKYFSKTDAPLEFASIKEKYPLTRYVDSNAAANAAKIKLSWHKINEKELPQTKFFLGDMKEFIEPDEASQTIVYVIENSITYNIENDSDYFADILNKIGTQCKDKKHVYLVIGGLEKKFLDGGYDNEISPEARTKTIKKMNETGFNKITGYWADKLKLDNFDHSIDKIYQMK